MHQDQRIGLALGVLLVGACAAFFFRNETRSTSHAPRLQHAQELDDRIAERSTRPYLKGIEAVEAADRQRSGADDDHESQSDQGSNYWNPLDPSGNKFARPKSPRDRTLNGRLVDANTEVQELAPIAIPNDGQYRSEQGPGHGVAASQADAKSDRVNSKSNGATADGRTHIVQKGETLSSIAAKTLGNPNRFHELFEANQDQLKDPNDVRLGMILRIPDHRTESASRSPGTNAHRANEADSPTMNSYRDTSDSLNEAIPPAFDRNSVSPGHNSSSLMLPPEMPSDVHLESPEYLPNDDSSPSKKFVPARRSPVPVRQIGPQTKNGEQREVGGRKLSQASLNATAGKVAR